MSEAVASATASSARESERRSQSRAAQAVLKARKRLTADGRGGYRPQFFRHRHFQSAMTKRSSNWIAS